MAEQWFRLLLTDAQAPRHGLDLFGRDALVLGKEATFETVTRLSCSALRNTERIACKPQSELSQQPLLRRRRCWLCSWPALCNCWPV